MTNRVFRYARPAILVLVAIVMTTGNAGITAGSAAWAEAKSAVDPYWASIRDATANMRTGPRASYPIKWVYKRKNMPVKVIGKDSVWRKIEDMDGDQGWMHVKLLSGQRTAVVTGTEIQPMLDAPKPGASINWRAEPGVVGKISECGATYCLFDVAGRLGYIKRGVIWGDEPLPGEDDSE